LEEGFSSLPFGLAVRGDCLTAVSESDEVRPVAQHRQEFALLIRRCDKPRRRWTGLFLRASFASLENLHLFTTKIIYWWKLWRSLLHQTKNFNQSMKVLLILRKI
jgi:hypothetical protein